MMTKGHGTTPETGRTPERPHQILVCRDCPHTGAPCHLGLSMLASLNAATTAAGAVLPPDFQVSGTACMTGCTRPCTVAFRASAGACYLFGDVSADADIDALVAQATNPAVPQAVIVTEPRTGRLQ